MCSPELPTWRVAPHCPFHLEAERPENDKRFGGLLLFLEKKNVKKRYKRQKENLTCVFCLIGFALMMFLFNDVFVFKSFLLLFRVCRGEINLWFA